MLKNDEITHSDVFLELPIALQNEVFDKMWSYPSQNISKKQCKFHKGFSKYQKFDKSKTVQVSPNLLIYSCQLCFFIAELI